VKHRCENLVTSMPEQAAEPALSGLRLNLRILSVVIFNFASYLTIGLPLAVLPGYVHETLGYSAFWAGLVISLQYFATLVSRPHAGRYADMLGPKKVVVFGLCGAFICGLGYLLADLQSGSPLVSLVLLCRARHSRYRAKFCRDRVNALGRRGSRFNAYRPCYFLEWYRDLWRNGAGGAAWRDLLSLRGLSGLGGFIMAVAFVAIACALPRAAVKASKGKPLPFRAVLGMSGFMGWDWRWVRPGLALLPPLSPSFMTLKGGMVPPSP
jgi:MFS family permease